MEKTNKITFLKVLAWSASILLPVLAVSLGCSLLFFGTIFNIAFAVTFLLIPVISIALLALILFSKKKAFSKVVRIIFVLVVFAVSFLLSRMVGTFEIMHEQNTEIEKSYTEVCEDFAPMPTLEELGHYTRVEHYDYVSTTFGIFTSEADTLIVHYDSADYQEQKAFLDNKYAFQKEDMTALEYACVPSATINGYSFRVLDIDEYGSEIQYPKQMVFIATNDQSHSIAYTAFCDDDLDYIESLEDFLLNVCGWKHIIK